MNTDVTIILKNNSIVNIENVIQISLNYFDSTDTDWNVIHIVYKEGDTILKNLFKLSEISMFTTGKLTREE